MRRQAIAMLFLGLLLVAGETRSLAQPTATEPQSSPLAGPMGMFALRLGLTSYGDSDDVTKGGGGPHLGLQVQPLIHTSHPLRFLYVDIHAGASLGDFSDSQHKGIEVGASFVTWERASRLFRFGANLGLSVDRWNVFDDNDQLPQGDATSLGAVFRPSVRLWRFELSIPIFFGRTLGSRDDQRDLSKKSISFWSVDLGLLI